MEVRSLYVDARKANRKGDGRPLATLPWRQMAGPCLVLAECSASSMSSRWGRFLRTARRATVQSYSEEDFPPRALAQRAFAVAADAVSDPRKRLR